MANLSDIKKKLKAYRYLDQTARDVQALMENFKSLKIREQKPFIHPNGSKENCAAVSGTIPVQIRGTTYNIPVTIWLRPSHPDVPPLVYVTPTETMGIQQSRFVDNSGMVYLPYISEWRKGQSDLITLAQIMCATFADHCPVYSKNVQQSSGYPHGAVRPPVSHQTPGGYGQPYRANQPRQPYPTGQPAYPTSQPYPSSGGMPTPFSGTGGYYQPAATGAASTPYPAQGHYGGYPQSPQAHSSSVPVHPQPATSLSANYVSAVPTHSTPSAEQERQAIEEQEQIKRQSLESAVQDKIKRQVVQVLEAAQDEMDGMLETQEKLKKGNEEITKMLSDMSTRKREVEESIDMLKNKKAELMSLLDYLRAQPDTIDVDEAVTATSPLYNQILRLYAEENAIDDTIYYLGEALRKGVIDLDAFLKHVRELSRQQFMARATIMKARTTAGLAQHGVPA